MRALAERLHHGCRWDDCMQKAVTIRENSAIVLAVSSESWRICQENYILMAHIVAVDVRIAADN